MEDLHIKKILFRWFPNVLMKAQKKNRIEVSEQLLSILQSLSVSQTNKIIIADEPWFFLYYTLDQMWCYSGIRPTKPLHKIAEEKVMIFTAFLLKGLVFAKALPK